MPTIDIDDTEFAQLMFILANAEGKGINWTVVNPLMMKIGGQARNQANQRQAGVGGLASSMQPPAPPPMRTRGNKEASHE